MPSKTLLNIEVMFMMFLQSEQWVGVGIRNRFQSGKTRYGKFKSGSMDALETADEFEDGFRTYFEACLGPESSTIFHAYMAVCCAK